MEIVVSRALLRRSLIALPALMVVFSFCAEVGEARGYEGPFDLVAFFSLSYEENLPTWYSSCLLFSCAFLLALIASSAGGRGDRWTRHWWGMAAAFAYISLDETATIHEHASEWFDLDGILYFGWVVPAGVIVLLLAAAYARFLLDLPRPTRNRFVAAAALYVGGALGVELPLAAWTDAYGDDNLGYALIDLVEESMEIAGASLFLYTLTGLLTQPAGSLKLYAQADPR